MCFTIFRGDFKFSPLRCDRDGGDATPAAADAEQPPEQCDLEERHLASAQWVSADFAGEIVHVLHATSTPTEARARGEHLFSRL